MVLVITIDTSHNKRYSCVVSGKMRDLNELYKSIDNILIKLNQKGPFHWRRMRRKVRISAKKGIYELINNSKLHFNIFEHKFPGKISSKEFYLKHIPNLISKSLDKWLERKGGTVLLRVDKDYTVKGIEKSTERFTENLIRRLCERLVGPVSIRRNKDILATIKQINGNILNFIGSVSSKEESKGIQIADLVLGYYLYDRVGIKNKVYFKKYE